MSFTIEWYGGVYMCSSKTMLRRVLPLCALLGALFASLFLYKATARPQVFLTTSSPGKTYTVHLAGQKDRPHIPAISHKVYFSVLKNSENFLSDKQVHSGDWLDPSFEISYPRHTWVSENVLSFYRNEYFSKGTLNTLTVVNSTNEIIKYLRVISDCMVLLFDIQPKSMTELSIPAPRGNLKWVSVEGEYSEGRSIKKNGVDFVIPDEPSGHFTYYIYITGDDLRIESPQLEKYRGTK